MVLVNKNAFGVSTRQLLKRGVGGGGGGDDVNDTGL